MLLPCHACARHIRDHERSCPFCGVTVEASPSKTLQRVATAAAVGVALTMASCESSRPATKYGGPPVPIEMLQPTSTTNPTSAASVIEAPKTQEAPKKEMPREEMKDIYGAPPPPKKLPKEP